MLDAAATGEPCALEIVDGSADELARAAQAVMRRLAFPDAPVAFCGGLLGAPNPLSTALCARLGLATLPRPLHPPVTGAVLLAIEADRQRRLANGREPVTPPLTRRPMPPQVDATEARNPRTTEIDCAATLDVLRLLNAEDATVAAVVQAALPQIAAALEAIVAALLQGGRLIYVGAGTSGRLGVLDAAECVPTFGVEPGRVVGLIAGGAEALTHAIEGAEDNRGAGRRDLRALLPTARDVVVGLAASGRTPYVLAALEAAREAGAHTVGIACNAPSPLLEVAESRHRPGGGARGMTGSTRLKAGTAQKMVLNMLSTASMIRLGKAYGNLMVDLRVTNRKLSERARADRLRDHRG